MKRNLSVVIITRNEKENIGACLEQIKWVDEIIVVDAHSEDGTRDIAQKYTDKVILHKYISNFDQRSFALGLAKGDLILILDADEFLDKKALDEIRNILSCEEVYDGYKIMREAYFLDRPLYFSEKPEPEMRLFRKGAGFVTQKYGHRGHEAYDVRGRTKILNGVIRHYTADTISERIKKIDFYSTVWADEMAEYSTRPPSTPTVFYIALKSFIGNFLINGGFRDGFVGFMWCSLKAAENFLKYAKLWERNCRT
ncbi:MAG: hypothetical protein A3J72_03185 [Nitrospirae bacterium RIFCSPHIGHO2_02_FULL_40_19]|nr:MAG: hypothetical protein A3J72_03185 [Nitrospirae bacterium RIFCSPHIGHO2_02_FULL_40_19]